MLIIVSLLVIFTYTSQHVNTFDAATLAQMAAPFWDKIMNQMSEKPKLLMRFQNGRGKIKQKIIKWNKNRIDPSKGPYSYIFSMADKLVKDRDISKCEMQYYEDTEPLSIDDDDSILDLLEAGPDMTGNKRLIDIVCDEYYEEGGAIINNRRYRKATNAYNYAVAASSEPSVSEKDIAESKLKNANLGGYSLEAEGVSIIDVTGDEFLGQAIEIADAFKWDLKTKSIINAVPKSDKVFQSRSYVTFDAQNWKIVGSFAKFAGWKSDKENNKSSMFVATSKFEFTIPRSEREGDLIDKYLGGSGGTISQEYIEYIKIILRYKAIEASKQDLNKPDPNEWTLDYDHNKPDL